MTHIDQRKCLHSVGFLYPPLGFDKLLGTTHTVINIMSYFPLQALRYYVGVQSPPEASTYLRTALICQTQG